MLYGSISKYETNNSTLIKRDEYNKVVSKSPFNCYISETDTREFERITSYLRVSVKLQIETSSTLDFNVDDKVQLEDEDREYKIIQITPLNPKKASYRKAYKSKLKIFLG